MRYKIPTKQQQSLLNIHDYVAEIIEPGKALEDNMVIVKVKVSQQWRIMNLLNKKIYYFPAWSFTLSYTSK